MVRFILAILLVPAAFCARLPDGEAREAMVGPVEATVIRVIDGDSLEMLARVWPGHRMIVTVRLAGIDAPELRAACPAERRAAGQARDGLARLVADRTVVLREIRAGAFYGRVVARVWLDASVDVSEMMLREGLAVPYRSGERTVLAEC